jgi:hypothetical protein
MFGRRLYTATATLFMAYENDEQGHSLDVSNISV